MIRNHYWILLLLTLSFNSYSQQIKWAKSSVQEVYKLQKMDRETIPENFLIYKSNLETLKKKLKKEANQLIATNSNLSFPNAEGTITEYEIREIPVLSPKLAEKYPNIKSYLGISTQDKNQSIRFSITPFGLHAILYSPDFGINYIDTYSGDQNYFIAYNRSDLNTPNRLNCLVETNDDFFPEIKSNVDLQNDPQNLNAKHREYRLAMACTIEYANFHINAANAIGIPVTTEADKKEIVLAAMATTMTRVNFIFERDLGIHMNLVDNNDEIIFIDSDNFDNNNAYNLIDQSHNVISKIIGTNNFDIGHTVSTGDGGLANLNAPCNNYSKGMGITGSSSPVGDPFDVDFVAHEMGHQFGANHTFNSSCSYNRNNFTAVEPGSGNSIMGYAGVCSPGPTGGNVNVQNNSTPFFNSISIAEINNFVNIGGNCSQNTPITIPAPVANAGGNRVLPVATPFFLKGIIPNNTDTSTYTYNWEQIDKEISTQPPTENSINGPNFKFIAPTQSSTRYLPNFKDVIEGTQTMWEVLPIVPRTMNFRMIVRDNNTLEGGQTAFDDITVNFVEAGPFQITYPDSLNIEFEAGTTETILWDVANTDGVELNTSHVNILFSADNGLTFSTLKTNTANDGKETIEIPNYSTEDAVILIEPTNSSYYTISKKFKINNGTASIETPDSENLSVYPNPTSDILFISLPNKINQDLEIAIYDITGRLVYRENSIPLNTTTDQHQISMSSFPFGMYLVQLKSGQLQKTIKVIKQ
ncbi:zinc-dependent metalloprotease [Myroides guanonis]|uniref:Por secretion system C-terminal sorting domain-containing protein n=1 Tax=Myroides guanonis TaxID=1150112 RepID=A0A1I3TCM1_9FLAO|nr:zinc-dependent metalloprotease family protein [Myroides guanonis]SFJ68242.1 Por secretion system C-terminal sorting domain-containing protein [Myroides guanonis]